MKRARATPAPASPGAAVAAAALAAWLAAAGCARETALPTRPPEVRLKPHEEVVLDGSGSFDPEGEGLAYRWRQVAGPAVELRDADTPWPRFRPPAPGRYEFELAVAARPQGGRGELLEGPPARLAVDVLAPNRPPKVELAPLLRAEPGQWVVLDGGGATDPDGDVLSFRWELVGGEVEGPPDPLATLVEMDPPGGRARRVRARAWRAGEYVFRLTATDAFGDEASGQTRLRVAPNDLPPVAIPRVKGAASAGGDLAGGHFPLRLGAWPHPKGGVNEAPVAVARAEGPRDQGEYVLNGAASSDPNGDAIEFRWRQSGGPHVRILRPLAPGGPGGSPGLARVAFAPPAPGRYAFELVVSDGVLESAAARVEVVVRGEAPGARAHAPPPPEPERAAAPLRTPDESLVAHAGEDVTVETGAEVALDGRRSRRARGADLIHDWRQVSGPRVTSFRLSPAEGDARPRFTPEEPGQYEFELRVSRDRLSWSGPDRVRVSVLGANRPPAVDAPASVLARAGDVVRVAARSGDPDGDPTEVTWRRVGRRRAVLRQEGGVAEFVAPEGGCTLEAAARDARGGEARTLVEVRVPGEGRAPVAIARARGELRPGRRVVLDGRESYDLEGKPLEWRWRLAGTTLVALRGSDRPVASFRAPAAAAYEFELVVSATGRQSSPARVSVEVPEPVYGDGEGIALTPVPARVTAGRPVVLDASATRAGAARPRIVWRQTEGPLLLPAGGAAAARLVLAPTEPGRYGFSVVAEGFDAREVRFEAVTSNAPPVASARVRAGRGGTVVLDGSRSRDPEGAPLLYRWTEVGGAGLGLDARPTRDPGLVLRDAPPGRHAVMLAVTDGERVARSRVVEFEVAARPGSGRER